MPDLDHFKKMSFRLVSQETLLFEGYVSQVIAQTVQGAIEILPGHIPFCGLLSVGTVKITTYPAGEKDYFYVSGGIIELQANQVTILADTSIHASDIDIDNLAQQEAISRAQLDQPSLEKTQKVLAELAALNTQRKVVKEIGKMRDK